MPSALQDFISERLKDHRDSIAYDTFSDLVSHVGLTFSLPSKEANRIVQKELQKRNIEVGTQEASRGKMYPAKEQTVPWSKGNPGDLAEPKSSLKPLSSSELTRKALGTEDLRIKPGDYVDVKEDIWRAPFKGILKKINEDETFDVKDPLSGWLYESIPSTLVSRPKASGRPIAPPQHRRVGDPEGFLDSPGDVGGRDGVREYPGLFHLPKGHEQQYVTNPPSIYDLRKEASAPDLYYSHLMTNLVKKYGASVAVQVDSYLRNGQIPTSTVIKIMWRHSIGI